MLDDLSFAQPFIERTGWTLLHFLWQGMLVALLLAGFLQLLRRCSAELRYAACLAALLLLTVLPAATWFNLSAPASVTANELPSVLAAGVPAPYEATSTPGALADPSWQDRLHAATRSLLPWGVGTWALGVLLLSGRLLGGWLRVRRLRTCAVQSVNATWHDRLAKLAVHMRVRRSVQLLQSALVESPVVVGWMRPVILTPIGFFAGLPPEQIEAILAHELAHLRRHDYLVNLLQSVIETLLFYHPAVWWVSRQVRLEREYCCDDAAAAASRDRLTYARALAELEARRSRGGRLLAPAASDGALLRRIRRLINDAPAPTSSPSHIAAGCLLVGVAATFALACAPDPVQASRSAPEPAPALVQAAPADTSRPDSAGGAFNSIVVRGDLLAKKGSLFGGQVLFLDGDSLQTVIERHIGDLQLGSLEEQIQKQMRSVEQHLDNLRETGVLDVERYMRRLDEQMQHVSWGVIDSLRKALPPDSLIGKRLELLKGLYFEGMLPGDSLKEMSRHLVREEQRRVHRMQERFQMHQDSLALRHQQRMQKRQAFIQRRQKATQKDQERHVEQHIRMLEERARQMREEAERMQKEAERLQEEYARRQEEKTSGAEKE